MTTHVRILRSTLSSYIYTQMKLPQRILLIVAGVLGIGAFFLPYINIDYGVGKFNVSGWDYIQTLIDTFVAPAETGVVAKAEDQIYDGIYQIGIKPLLHESSTTDKLTGAGVILVLLGPFFFLLYSIGYLIRGIVGKPYKRGVFFNLLFLGFCWLVFHFVNKQIPLVNLNFFWIADFGYWVGFIALCLAPVSDFLGKEEDITQ